MLPLLLIQAIYSKAQCFSQIIDTEMLKDMFKKIYISDVMH